MSLRAVAKSECPSGYLDAGKRLSINANISRCFSMAAGAFAWRYNCATSLLSFNISVVNPCSWGVSSGGFGS